MLLMRLLMMLTDYEEAVRIFQRLPLECQYATLHPRFVEIDSLRYESAEPVFFTYQEDRKLFYHAGLKIPIEGTSYFDFQTAYGYGGPVFIDSDDAFMNKCTTFYYDWCSKEQVLAEFIRFHPMLNGTKYYYGDVFVERSTVYVDLAKPLGEEYRTLTKRRLRQAEKAGLRCSCHDDSIKFERFFIPLYEQLMREWQAGDEYFFSHEYYHQLIQWEKSWLLACENDSGEIMAAGIFLYCGNHLEYHLGASTEEGRKSGAMYALIDYAARLGKMEGCTILFLGGGTTNDVDNSLLFFKSGFSDQKRDFYIGCKIHLPIVYDVWRKDWIKKQGKEPDKLLFYRFK